LTDDQVIEHARTAKNGAKFTRLWSGDAEPDPSSADAALVAMVAFWTQDFDQLDRLFRRSGLMRPKWDEKRGQTTYGQRPIAAVLSKPGEHYTPPSRARIGGEAPTGGTDKPKLSMPTPLPQGLPPVQPFAVELLPEALREWVVDIAHRHGEGLDSRPAAGRQARTGLHARLGRPAARLLLPTHEREAHAGANVTRDRDPMGEALGRAQ
jgi:hypothetical protein